MLNLPEMDVKTNPQMGGGYFTWALGLSHSTRGCSIATTAYQKRNETTLEQLFEQMKHNRHTSRNFQFDFECPLLQLQEKCCIKIRHFFSQKLRALKKNKAKTTGGALRKLERTGVDER
jgi:hypothetical protein